MLLKWNERPTDRPTDRWTWRTWNLENLQPGPQPGSRERDQDLQPEKAQKTTRRSGKEEGKRKRMWQKREGKKGNAKRVDRPQNMLWVGQSLTLTLEVAMSWDMLVLENRKGNASLKRKI